MRLGVRGAVHACGDILVKREVPTYMQLGSGEGNKTSPTCRLQPKSLRDKERDTGMMTSRSRAEASTVSPQLPLGKQSDNPA